jgi:hypothetical protein
VNAYRTNRPFSFLLPLGLAAAALVASPDARACSQAIDRSPTFPEPNSSYPANAAIYSFGGYFPLGFSSVTIDGVAATLVSAEGLSVAATPEAFFAEPSFVLVSPEPRPGQRVIVRGTTCGASYMNHPERVDELDCPPFELAYTATAPDETAPVVPPRVTFSVEDVEYLGSLCEQEFFPTYVAHFPTPAEGAGAAPVAYTIEEFADETLTEPFFSMTVVGSRSAQDVNVGRTATPARCIRVRAFDLAGHEAAAPLVDCALPAPPVITILPPDAPPIVEPQKESSDGCQLGGSLGAPAGASGARAMAWAGLLAAAALVAGGRRRRAALSSLPPAF